MKKLLFLLFLMVATVATQAQEGRWADEELTLGVCYRHADAQLQRPTGVSQFGLQDPRNSVGPCGGYTHFIGRKNGRGNFGIGFDAGVLLTNNPEGTVDGGNIALGRASYKMVYMNNAPGKKVRPGVEISAGAAREQFRNRCVQGAQTITCSRGVNAWTYGGGAFVDFGEDRKRLRIGAKYYRSVYLKQSPLFPDRKDKHNFEANVGLVF
jgi:hypothetical protein